MLAAHLPGQAPAIRLMYLAEEDEHKAGECVCERPISGAWRLEEDA